MADDQQPQAAADQPVPGKVQPQPADMIRPPATAEAARPAQPEAKEEPRDKAARLRREAAEIEAGLPAPDDTVRVKVEEPHIQFEFGGTVIGNEFVPVHTMRLTEVQQAADAAGVKLTTE
jgi:hypothetical protein